MGHSFQRHSATDEDEGVTDGAIRNITKRVDVRGGQEKYGVTPHKKRPKVDFRSPALEANYELTMPEVETTLGDNPEDIMRNLATEWRVMANNVNMLKEMVNGCWGVIREKSEATVEEFSELDFKLARLANLIGARSDDIDPVPILRILCDMSKDIAELQLNPASTSSASGSGAIDALSLQKSVDLAKGFEKAKLAFSDIVGAKNFIKDFDKPGSAGELLRQKMGKEVLTSFQPVLDLLAKLSSNKSAPGDVLEQELKGIRASLSKCKPHWQPDKDKRLGHLGLQEEPEASLGDWAPCHLERQAWGQPGGHAGHSARREHDGDYWGGVGDFARRGGSGQEYRRPTSGEDGQDGWFDFQITNTYQGLVGSERTCGGGIHLFLGCARVVEFGGGCGRVGQIRH
jgi:hypothetical protein